MSFNPETAASASPSSRRAWIEILYRIRSFWFIPVALLAEGVDRNKQPHLHTALRRQVALLAEGVDRNIRELLLIVSS